MMSLPTASRKAIHLACWSFAGHATAHPILCLNPHSGTFFAFLQSPIYSSPTHIKPKSSLVHPLPPGSATDGPTHSPWRARNVGCTTSRDFVPWRFCDAAFWSAWLPLVRGVAETCTEKDSCTAQKELLLDTDYQRVRKKRGRQGGAKPSYTHAHRICHTRPLIPDQKILLLSPSPLVGELPEQDQVSTPKWARLSWKGVENQHAQHRTFDRANLPDQNGKSTCDATNVELQTRGRTAGLSLNSAIHRGSGAVRTNGECPSGH